MLIEQGLNVLFDFNEDIRDIEGIRTKLFELQSFICQTPPFNIQVIAQCILHNPPCLCFKIKSLHKNIMIKYHTKVNYSTVGKLV